MFDWLKKKSTDPAIDFTDIVSTERLWANARPEQKIEIVKALLVFFKQQKRRLNKETETVRAQTSLQCIAYRTLIAVERSELLDRYGQKVMHNGEPTILWIMPGYGRLYEICDKTGVFLADFQRLCEATLSRRGME